MDWKEDKKDTDMHRRSVRRLSQTKISLNDMDTIDNDGVFTPDLPTFGDQKVGLKTFDHQNKVNSSDPLDVKILELEMKFKKN